MATYESDESAAPTSEAAETRKDASATLDAASSFVDPGKTGIGQKVAIATAVYRLARRYPVPALIVGGIALAFYMGRHRAHEPPMTRH